MNHAGLHTSAREADTIWMMVHLRAGRFHLRQGYGGQAGGQARHVVIAMTVVMSGCASTGAVYTPRPFPMPGSGSGGVAIPAPAPADPPEGGRYIPGTSDGHIPGTAEGYALSSTALSLRGAPYRNGGTDPNGFDCSGLVRYVFGQHGVSVPREAREQFRLGKNVPRDRLAAGDLVFFSTVAPGASHVGIAIGGDQFVHAPSERGVVRVEQLSAQYWSTRFIGAKRVD